MALVWRWFGVVAPTHVFLALEQQLDFEFASESPTVGPGHPTHADRRRLRRTFLDHRRGRHGLKTRSRPMSLLGANWTETHGGSWKLTESHGAWTASLVPWGTGRMQPDGVTGRSVHRLALQQHWPAPLSEARARCRHATDLGQRGGVSAPPCHFMVRLKMAARQSALSVALRTHLEPGPRRPQLSNLAAERLSLPARTRELDHSPLRNGPWFRHRNCVVAVQEKTADKGTDNRCLVVACPGTTGVGFRSRRQLLPLVSPPGLYLTQQRSSLLHRRSSYC